MNPKVVTVINIEEKVGKSMLAYSLALYYNSLMNFGVQTINLAEQNPTLTKLLYYTKGENAGTLRYPKLWNDKFTNKSSLEINNEVLNIVDVGPDEKYVDNFHMLMKHSSIFIVPTTMTRQSLNAVEFHTLYFIFKNKPDANVVLIFNPRQQIIDMKPINETKDRLMSKYKNLKIISEPFKKIPEKHQYDRYTSSFDHEKYKRRLLNMPGFCELIKTINYIF